MDKIDDLRLLIDELDNNIMSMLDKRFNLSNEIGNIKAHAKTAVLDTKRETTILDKISKYSHSKEIGVVYKIIMEESKSLQRK